MKRIQFSGSKYLLLANASLAAFLILPRYAEAQALNIDNGSEVTVARASSFDPLSIGNVGSGTLNYIVPTNSSGYSLNGYNFSAANGVGSVATINADINANSYGLGLRSKDQDIAKSGTLFLNISGYGSSSIAGYVTPTIDNPNARTSYLARDDGSRVILNIKDNSMLLFSNTYGYYGYNGNFDVNLDSPLYTDVGKMRTVLSIGVVISGFFYGEAYFATGINSKVTINSNHSTIQGGKSLAVLGNGGIIDISLTNGSQFNIAKVTYISGNANGSSSVNLDSGAYFLSKDNIYMGDRGGVDFNILNGSYVSSNNISIIGNSNVDIRVLGNGSYLKTTSPFLIQSQNNGNSSVTISKGGSLKVPSVTVNGANSYLSFGGKYDELPDYTDEYISINPTIYGNGGNIYFNSYNDNIFQSIVTGSVSIHQVGPNKTTILSNNPTTGKTYITNGTLQFGDGGVTGAVYGDIHNDSRLIINRALLTRYEGSITGTGINDHNGSDVLTMTGNSSTFSGTSNVNNGTVYLNGTLGGDTNVMNGAFLGGTGTIGNVNVHTGGTLLGHQGDVFTIDGDLTLDSDSFIGAGLGQQSSLGLFEVTGDLVLDGALNIKDEGGFGPGVYRIIDYAGQFTDNTLDIGTVPTGIDPTDLIVQTSVAQQVNLIVLGDLALNFWDGPNPITDNVINGGTGVWDAAQSFWTNVNGDQNARWDSTFGIFQGAAGTVSVDHGLGAIQAAGMQFAVDGYNIIGDSIELTEAEALIRVGDGTGAENVTANIASELTGSAKLVKTDRGTLILDAANTYTGGTVIRSGVLQVSADNNLGHADGDVTMEGSRLRNTRAFTTARDFTMGTGGGVFETQADLTISGLISGPESLTKTGAASLIMTSDNTYGEGTEIQQGTIQLGDGGTSGWIQGDVSNYGTLVFNRSDAKSFDGVMSGDGRIIHQGTGTTTLSADSSALLGASEIHNGTLVVNGKLGGTLAVNKGRLHGIGTVGGTTLEATGVIAPGNSIGHLTINGDFVGKGGLIEIETALGGDNSPTDLLTITGATSGNATVQVSNVGGLGAQTVEGIKIIEVGGASNGLFTLKGDYVFQGDQAVVAGAYAYRLMQGGVSTAKDDDWYLRSTLTTPVTPTDPTDPTDPTEPTEPTEPSKPEPPLYQPGVPLYEVYPQALLGLNRLGTLQQRVGNRSWQDSHGDYGLGDTEGKGIWTRIDAGHRKVEPRSSTTDSTFKQDYYRLQVGMDNLVSQNERGALVAGASVDIVSGKTNVSSQYGNGRIKTDGFGLGGNVTWYADDGVYVDGQAKINWYRSDLTSRLVEGRLTDRNHATGYGLSLEAGKRIGVGENWTLTPQAQLVYSSISLDSFTDTFDARVSLNRANSALGRVGLAASRDKITTADDGQLTRSHFYGIANINYEFAGAPRMNVSGTRLQNREGRSSAELGLGGTYSWANDTYSIYGEGSAASNFHKFGNSYDLKGQIGFRVRW